MKRAAAFAVLALALCGCPVPEPEGDGGTLPDGGPCPRGLVLGTENAQHSFAALADGASLEIHRGPQGGWHVFVSAQASSLPRRGTLSYVLRTGSTVVSAPLRLDLENLVLEDIACGWERLSDALVFNGNAEGYRGASGELEVTFETFGAAPTTAKKSVSLF